MLTEITYRRSQRQLSPILAQREAETARDGASVLIENFQNIPIASNYSEIVLATIKDYKRSFEELLADARRVDRDVYLAERQRQSQMPLGNLNETLRSVCVDLIDAINTGGVGSLGESYFIAFDEKCRD
jgi:hypothetical protein